MRLIFWALLACTHFTLNAQSPLIMSSSGIPLGSLFEGLEPVPRLKTVLEVENGRIPLRAETCKAVEQFPFLVVVVVASNPARPADGSCNQDTYDISCDGQGENGCFSTLCIGGSWDGNPCADCFASGVGGSVCPNCTRAQIRFNIICASWCFCYIWNCVFF
jgi:hypothetical protein